VYAGDADGVLNVRAQITRPVIAVMERCRVIVRYGIGVDTIDIAAATERVSWWRMFPTIALMRFRITRLRSCLCLAPDDCSDIACQRRRLTITKMPHCTAPGADLWLARLRENRLASCRKSLGFRYAGHCMRSVSVRGTRPGDGAESVSFDALLERSDFISLHAPLNEKTRHILGNKHLQK